MVPVTATRVGPRTIGILPLAEPGHVNSIMQLCRELSDGGHDVRCLTTERGAALFRERSLPYSIVHDPEMPLPELRLGEFRPDYLLVDTVRPAFAIWAWHAGMSVINLSTTFPLHHDSRVPPVCSDLTPGDDEATSGRIAAAWDDERRRHDTIKDGRLWSHTEILRRIAARRGFPDHLIDARAAVSITVRFPELVLAPEELDFPRASQDLVYAGPNVDLSRHEPPLPPGIALSNDRPLVYCSFGSQVQRYPDARARLELLVEAGRQLSGVQLVIAADVEHSLQPPGHIAIVARAPQLAMLRRAAAMVSHGGLNGLKEALCCGVPVVILPFDLDQPGNAARIQHHGLGRALSWTTTTASQLAATIRDVLDDAGLRRRVTAASARFQDALSQRQAAIAVERLIATLPSR